VSVRGVCGVCAVCVCACARACVCTCARVCACVVRACTRVRVWCVCVCARTVTTNSTWDTTRHPHCQSEKGFSLEAVIDSASQSIYHLVMAVDSSPPFSQQSTLGPTACIASSRHIHVQLMCRVTKSLLNVAVPSNSSAPTRHVCHKQCTSPPIARFFVLRPNKIA
jgi:hypothetical protein